MYNNRIKKILIIMPSLKSGGAEKVLIDILNELSPSKFNISLLILYKEGVYLDKIPQYIKTIFIHKTTFIFKVCRAIFTRLNMMYIFQIMNKKRIKKAIDCQYDSIISFMEGESVVCHSWINGYSNNNITWVHIDLKKNHWSLKYFLNKKQEAECYSKMTKIVFVSEDAKKAFEDLYKIDTIKTVIYNFIDKESIIEKSKIQLYKKEKFTICTVGRLHHQKRYDRLLHVAKRLLDEGYEIDFIILGIGPEERRIKAMSMNLRINNSVHFLGFQDNPYPYIKNSDIYLSTSESEGLPLVICEAMCLGIPIVATNITGHKELLGESLYGLIVNEDYDSIYHGLKKIIDNTNLRLYYTKKSQERSFLFNTQKTMNKIYEIV